MLAIDKKGKIDIRFKDGQLLEGDIVSDVLAVIFTTVQAPNYVTVEGVDHEAWVGNLYNPISIGTILENYVRSGVRNLNTENSIVMAVRDACSPLVSAGRLKSFSSEFERINKKVYFIINLVLPNNEKLPLNVPMDR